MVHTAVCLRLSEHLRVGLGSGLGSGFGFGLGFGFGFGLGLGLVRRVKGEGMLH